MGEKQALVPRLRFPEFLEAGEWRSDYMGDLYGFHPTNTFSRDKLNYTEGEVKNIHYGDIHTKFATLFDVTKELVPFINDTEPVERIRPENYCIEGDVIFADASEDMEDVGKSIEIVNSNNEKIVSGLHTILARQLTNRLVIRFGGYLFKSGVIRKQIKREAQGAKVLGISSRRLSRIKVCYPSDREEQQKIADCLSSLDALIAAQADKIDALKTHKKGLMQQLFPREGETVPRLRFPEFRNAGEWEPREVGEVFNVTRGYVLSMTLVNDARTEDTPYPVYSSQTKRNGLCGYYGEYLYKDAITWTTDGANAGDVNFRQGKFYCTNVCGVLINEGGYANPCTAELINSVAKKHVSYVGNPKLMNGVMSRIVVPFPSLDEQQRIAECLSFLDVLIAVYTGKLDALKSHKKGLIQRLFPSSESIK